MRIVILTGMPGSGKSELANVFREEGYPVIVMGDVVRRETRKRGLEPNPTNTGRIMLELRDRFGPGAIARMCVDEIAALQSEIVVIEGCRSLAEVEEFSRLCDDVLLVCVHSSPKTRFRRLQSRGREDAPPDWKTFRERDLREISVGIGGVIALSDNMIINEGDLESLRENGRRLMMELS
ncbi:MAG: AAA family ATPase [Candidatus Thorarchaeota archaeon]